MEWKGAAQRGRQALWIINSCVCSNPAGGADHDVGMGFLDLEGDRAHELAILVLT